LNLNIILAPLSVKTLVASTTAQNFYGKFRVLIKWNLRDTFFDWLVIKSSTECGERQLYLVSTKT